MPETTAVDGNATTAAEAMPETTAVDGNVIAAAEATIVDVDVAEDVLPSSRTQP